MRRCVRSRRRLSFAALGVFAILPWADTGAWAAPGDAGDICAGAIQAAQVRYAVPDRLLYAIGQVESGRVDGRLHQLVPWPWTAHADNQSYYFNSKKEAVAWVRGAEARGISSIDVGCMQVNLRSHPSAFRSLNDAFDPGRNADYAARFLTSLYAGTGDWQKAAGLYHSQSLALAVPYARKVEAALTGQWSGDGAFGAPTKPTMLTLLQSAWGATLPPGSAPPVAENVEPAHVMPVHLILRNRITKFSRRRNMLLSYAH